MLKVFFFSSNPTWLRRLFVSTSIQTARSQYKRLLSGEEHPNAAQSYFSIGVTQHAGDVLSALQSVQRALDIRVKLFGKEHPDTA